MTPPPSQTRPTASRTTANKPLTTPHSPTKPRHHRHSRKRIIATKPPSPKSRQIHPMPPLHFLDLPTDVLQEIIRHVQQPAYEGRHPIITEGALSRSLPLSQTCTTLQNVWHTTHIHIELCLAVGLTNVGLAHLTRNSGPNTISRLSIRHCTSLTTPAFIAIATHCKTLHTLDVSHTQIQDAELVAITKANKKTLRSLAIHACPKVTEEGLHTAVNTSEQLTFLDIGRNAISVTDTVVETAVKLMGSSLRTLILSDCTRLTKRALMILGSHAVQLVSLTLRSLPIVTDRGLNALCGQIGSTLHILDVLHCPNISLDGYLGVVRAHCPHINRHLQGRPWASRSVNTSATTASNSTSSSASNSSTNSNTSHNGTETASQSQLSSTPPQQETGLQQLRQEPQWIEQEDTPRNLHDCVVATLPALIYRISATDAVRRKPALYFLLVDESALRAFRIVVQAQALNLSHFGSVLVSNFGNRPTRETKHILLSRFGHQSPLDEDDKEGGEEDKRRVVPCL